eukprot:1123724_1
MSINHLNRCDDTDDHATYAKKKQKTMEINANFMMHIQKCNFMMINDNNARVLVIWLFTNENRAEITSIFHKKSTTMHASKTHKIEQNDAKTRESFSQNGN